jgi:hypothetical protein
MDEKLCRVPLDKSEGSVKAKISSAVREHRLFARGFEDQDSGNLTLNHSAVEPFVPPTIDSATTSTMILLCEHPVCYGMRERPINVSV